MNASQLYNSKSKNHNSAYLGLGSNLKNPTQQVEHAILCLDAIEQIHVIARSSFYQSKALIPPERPDEIQQDYINAVIIVDTVLDPFTLLTVCQQIENQMGRVRSNKRWEARIIDIDLLLFNDITISSIALTIPHPEMKNRKFVLDPLFEITPDLVLPDGDLLRNLLH